MTSNAAFKDEPQLSLAELLKRARKGTRPGCYRPRKWRNEPYSIREAAKLADMGKDRLYALEKAAGDIRLGELLRLAAVYKLESADFEEMIVAHEDNSYAPGPLSNQG